MATPADDDGIHNDAGLLRRIHPEQVVFDHNITNLAIK